MMKMEIWKDVVGFESRYEISNLGRLRSKTITLHKKDGKIEVRKGKMLTLRTNAKGYYTHLMSNGSPNRKLCTIHRLVAKAFIPNPENKPNIDHINTVRTDNRVKNLRWCTQSENNCNKITMTKYRKKGEFAHSDETKKKIGEKSKGRNVSLDTRIKLMNRAIPIIQFSKDGGLIRHFRSAREAADLFIANRTHILDCCRGKRRTAGGYRWIYEKNYKGVPLSPLPKIVVGKRKVSKEAKEKYKSILVEARKKLMVKVECRRLSGEYVGVFNSMGEASRALGVDDAAVSKCCSNKIRSTKGFKFTYYGSRG